MPWSMHYLLLDWLFCAATKCVADAELTNIELLDWLLCAATSVLQMPNQPTLNCWSGCLVLL